MPDTRTSQANSAESRTETEPPTTEMITDSTRAGQAFCAAAVPVNTKIPVPIMHPIPSAIRFQGPSDRRSSPRSASACSSSNDFFVKSPILNCKLQIANCPASARRRLGSGEGAWIRLARLEGEAIFGGSEAGVLLEEPREMALIAEAGCGGDVAERGGRCGKLPSRKL